MTAITTVAERGVDVTLISSEIGDQFLVYNAQRSYYEQLLRAGVKVYLFKSPSLLHAKHLTRGRRHRGDRLEQPRPALLHAQSGGDADLLRQERRRRHAADLRELSGASEESSIYMSGCCARP